MLSSGFVVAVMQITALLGLNKMIPQLPDFMKSAIFTFWQYFKLNCIFNSFNAIFG